MSFDICDSRILYSGMNRPFLQGITYNDISLAPGRVAFERDDIDLRTQLSRNIELDLPIVASPMDTVTGHRMAIALGQLGGIGFIHRNQAIDSQAEEVAKAAGANVQVGGAVGTYDSDVTRADSLVEAGASVLMVDSAHGHSDFVIGMTRKLKQRYPRLDVISGNIAEAQAAKDLEEAGADGLRVGMGPGAICTTRVISGMGVPQVSALQNVFCSELPFIADGGINHPGDLTKALAFATTVMLGRLLAGTTESPGDVIELTSDKVPARFKSIFEAGQTTRSFKVYRGMGSLGAMAAGKRLNAGGEFHGKDFSTDKLTAEGVEGLVQHTGSLQSVVEKLVEGLKSGMYYTGNRTLAELRANAQFYHNSHASMLESHPHDMIVTKDGGNYKF